MPFRKGISGNPGGRPKKGDSLAEAIRKAGQPRYRREMIGKMWSIAADAHGDALSRIKAAEWIAKHGWPHEQKQGLLDDLPSGSGSLTISWKSS